MPSERYSYDDLCEFIWTQLDEVDGDGIEQALLVIPQGISRKRFDKALADVEYKRCMEHQYLQQPIPAAPSEAQAIEQLHELLERTYQERDLAQDCAEKAESDLRDCKRDFRRYAGHYMLCAKKYSDDNACDCGLREAAERWREVGK